MDLPVLYQRDHDGMLIPLVAGVLVSLQTPGGDWLSLSAAGIVARIGGVWSQEELAQQGYVLPVYTAAEAPWGWLGPVSGVGPDGVAVALIAPAPEPDPTPLPVVRQEAIAALDAAREQRLARGWWTTLNLGAQADPQPYLYAGLPPEGRALIAGAIKAGEVAVASGAADAHPYHCASRADVLAGWPTAQRPHTVAQLTEVLAQGALLMATLGHHYDVALASVEAATDATEVQTAIDTANVALGAALWPEDVP